jgi:hypothetical protein
MGLSELFPLIRDNALDSLTDKIEAKAEAKGFFHPLSKAPLTNAHAF